MLKKIQFMALTTFGMLLACCQVQAEDTVKENPAMKTAPAEKNDQIDMKKLSEAFGNFIGRNLQAPGLKFDLESLVKGIREGSAGQPSPLTEKEYEEMMAAVQEKAFKEMSSSNLNSANDFMEKNRKVAGVVEVVPGKLQYLIVKEGQGAAVEPNFSPKIHYTGKYQDGTVFGTSEEMGGPITIPLNQTIPGFSKGILGMKEGEKRRLFVHPDLGYGTSGQLPPNELLIFEVELIKANSDDDKAAKTNVSSADDETNDDDDDLLFDDEELEESHETSKDKTAAEKTTDSHHHTK